MIKEYNLGQGTLRYWLKQVKKDWDEQKVANFEELKSLRNQKAELIKDNAFLKKADIVFAKEVD